MVREVHALTFVLSVWRISRQCLPNKVFVCPSTSVDEKCIYVLGLECKYFLVGTIVRSGVRVEVGVEIHVESFCAETPDCELQRRQQAIFFYRNTNRY